MNVVAGLPSVLHGVALCSSLDLMFHFDEAFQAHAPELSVLPPERIGDPDQVSFALSWRPAPDAFTPYRNLRAVFSIGAGVDAILACPSLPDVPVIRVEDPDQAHQMAGFAAFHVLWHHRNMAAHIDAKNRRAWERVVGGQSPKRKRIGVMGFGLMGRAIAEGLSALGYPVSTLSRTPPSPPLIGMEHLTADEMDLFLSQTDILINVLPLTPETEGILNRACFEKLPRGAALIQMGRGSHLIEEDLLAALDDGQLSGASLDVFSAEPLPAENPLWSHPRIFMTPHIASTPEPAAVVRSVQNGLKELLGSAEKPAPAPAPR
ncbi:2-hydroxyacid dehydrogenase [Hwanghaeella sp.]|uniref:2-hydroxyacid dehydrogenase n=1 Tax=Hwanghaeella sp. TaxID=2605943 RepID=UPI003CCB8BCF